MRFAGAARAVAALGAFFALWQIAVVALAVPAFLLPTPVAVLARLWFLAVNANLERHAATTIGQILGGFALGGALGILAGALFTRWPRLERLTSPLVLMLQTAPKIAIAPLLLLWLGLGPGPKIALVAIVVFFPAMAGAHAGFRYIDKSYRDLGSILRLSPLARFARIDLPFALAPIAAGLRVATTQAVTAAVVGELMGADRGLGYLLSVGQENSDPAAVIGVILLLSLIGWTFHEAVRAAERRLLGWHPSQRGARAGAAAIAA
jgi:NitT/TauT family transport system permease protein